MVHAPIAQGKDKMRWQLVDGPVEHLTVCCAPDKIGVAGGGVGVWKDVVCTLFLLES